jgi:PAS domain-containing protein
LQDVQVQITEVNRLKIQLTMSGAQEQITVNAKPPPADVTAAKQAEIKLRESEAYLAEAQRLSHTGSWAWNPAMGEFRYRSDECFRLMGFDPASGMPPFETVAQRYHPDDQPIIAETLERARRERPEFEVDYRIIHPGGEDLKRELVDVNEIIREMIVLLRSEATRYNISVQAELAADLPQIIGDRVQLQQVTMNLIVNSVDAMKEVDGSRELTIKSQRTENEQLQVSVSDTGIGLPQQAEQIFNAFFTTKTHGTGMGLRISRSIIESHGGRLWAADNFPRGATFQFTLPVTAAAATA